MAAALLPGNRLTLLRAGAEYFPALEEAIGAARNEVFLETYIYADDSTGRRVTRALCAAASRGAAVRIVVDAAAVRFRGEGGGAARRRREKGGRPPLEPGRAREAASRLAREDPERVPSRRAGRAARGAGRAG